MKENPMRRAISLTLDEKGTAHLLSGPGVHITEQLDTFNRHRAEGLPKGVAEFWFWATDSPRPKILHGAKIAAQLAAAAPKPAARGKKAEE